MLYKTIGAALALGLLLPASASAVTLGNTEVSFGGYIKFDTLYSDFSEGEPGASIARDFYIPSLTPVGSTDNATRVDAHARQTRFNFKTVTNLDEHTLTGYVELDFLVTPIGDERISNSFAPRLRHAFIKFTNWFSGDWLFGQTWSTFLDVGALPETVDFIGTTDGTIFIRQPQVRYSRNGFDIALENPETTITPNGGGARDTTDDNFVPDLVVRKTWSGAQGHIAIAGLVRQLACDNCTANNSAGKDSAIGGGGSLTGKFIFNNGDDVRFALNGGSGLGRYLGLNTLNGAVIDNTGEVEAIDSYGGFIAYRHLWNTRWRSNLHYSHFIGDADTNLTGLGVTESTYRVAANLLYSPVPPLTLGVELSHAEREIESGLDGSLRRIQFSAQYNFDLK